MTLADAYGAFVIVGIVTVATLIAEGALHHHSWQSSNFTHNLQLSNAITLTVLSYLLVYSTKDYIRACDRVRELNKKRKCPVPFLLPKKAPHCESDTCHP